MTFSGQQLSCIFHCHLFLIKIEYFNIGAQHLILWILSVSHNNLCNSCLQLLNILESAWAPFMRMTPRLGILWMDGGMYSVIFLYSPQQMYCSKGKALWKGHSHERTALWYLAPSAVFLFEPRERRRKGERQVYMSAGEMAQCYICFMPISY